MSPSRRGMSNSSCHDDVRAKTVIDGAFPSHLITGSFTMAAISGSKEDRSTSYVPILLGTGTSDSRDLDKKQVRSKFREEFGEVPRPGIFSKIRVFSGQGRTGSGSKSTSELVTNHVFLSDHGPKDAQGRRDMFLHGCLHAAESSPKRRSQAQHYDGTGIQGFGPGEIQPINGIFPLSDGTEALCSMGMSTFNRTGNTVAGEAPRPLNVMPRVSRGSLIRSKSTSSKKRLKAQKRFSAGAGPVSTWGDPPSYRQSLEPDKRVFGESVSRADTTDLDDSTSKNRGLKRGLSSARLLLSGRSGTRHKS